MLKLRCRSQSLEGNVVLIAGASWGLGLALGEELGREGARLGLCARNSDALEQAAKSIRQSTTAKVFSMPCDMPRMRRWLLSSTWLRSATSG
jgi:short-subunit dehydrogenase